MAKNKTKAFSRNILLAVMAAMLTLSGYFVYNDYQNILEAKRQETFNQLEAIAKTLSLTIHSEDYAYLLRQYPELNAITASDQDARYHRLNQLFHNTVVTNQLNTPSIRLPTTKVAMASILL